MFPIGPVRRARNIEEIAWEYDYWLQKRGLKKPPNATAMLAQCAELRAQESGKSYNVPVDMQK